MYEVDKKKRKKIVRVGQPFERNRYIFNERYLCVVYGFLHEADRGRVRPRQI